jgi:Type VIII secretion system (T8SS), CsgF protein
MENCVKKSLIFVSFMTFLVSPVLASPLVFQFKNPEFSGDGYSSHALTIENEEYTRKQQIEAQKKADAAAALAAQQNTNLAKFLNNLESRIYAQLSLQLSNAMFSDGSTSGTMNFEGNTISWIKDTTAGTITLDIIDTSGNKTEVVVPIGDFKF